MFLQLHQSVSSEVVLWAKGGNALLTFLVHGLRMDSRIGEVCKPITEPAKGVGLPPQRQFVKYEHRKIAVPKDQVTAHKGDGHITAGKKNE